jgi:hypothetical protein
MAIIDVLVRQGLVVEKDEDHKWVVVVGSYVRFGLVFLLRYCLFLPLWSFSDSLAAGVLLRVQSQVPFSSYFDSCSQLSRTRRFVSL